MCRYQRRFPHSLVSFTNMVKFLLGEENSNGTLPFRFEYDILDSNLIPRESFNDEFFELIGDILVDIIDRQEGDIVEPINRENRSSLT